MAIINEDNLVTLSEVKNLDKDELKELGTKAAAVLMLDGYNSAAPIIVAARKAIEYLNALSRALESQAIDEISLEDNKEIKAFGSIISMGSTGDRLNYKMDGIWKELNEAIKSREAILKLARKDPDTIRDIDGELIPALPLAGAAKTVIRVKL